MIQLSERVSRHFRNKQEATNSTAFVGVGKRRSTEPLAIVLRNENRSKAIHEIKSRNSLRGSAGSHDVLGYERWRLPQDVIRYGESPATAFRNLNGGGWNPTLRLQAKRWRSGKAQ